MSSRTLMPALLLTLAIMTGGCTPWVNIPAQAGDAASHNPNTETVQEVTIVAVRAAIADSPVAESSFQLVLPEKTLPAIYELMTPKISANATWSADAPAAGSPVVEVRRISIRGDNAEVDVLRPIFGGTGASQVVTVDLSWDAITSWRADRVKVWRVRSDDALRSSPFNAPPELQR